MAAREGVGGHNRRNGEVQKHWVVGVHCVSAFQVAHCCRSVLRKSHMYCAHPTYLDQRKLFAPRCTFSLRSRFRELGCAVRVHCDSWPWYPGRRRWRASGGVVSPRHCASARLSLVHDPLSCSHARRPPVLWQPPWRDSGYVRQRDDGSTWSVNCRLRVVHVGDAVRYAFRWLATWPRAYRSTNPSIRLRRHAHGVLPAGLAVLRHCRGICS